MEREKYLSIVGRAMRMVFKNLAIENIHVIGPHTGHHDDAETGILSLMKIKGDVEGKISVFSSINTASYIASKIADNHFNGTLHEIESGSGELCNLITGTVKRMIIQQNIRFSFTCPETFHIMDNKNNNQSIKTVHNYHFIVSFDSHVMYIEVTLKED